MTQISIVSGTYNRLSLLERMVESVRSCVESFDYEIVLVDGGSNDGTIEWCKEQEDVVLIQQGELLGAAKAYNEGCSKASGKYVVIVNDDIVMRSGTIKAAYDYMQRNPDVGQVAFHHEYQRKRSQDPRVAKALGYIYAQCCMIQKWLGDLAGWWGEYDTYGGDTQLSMILWEHGWKVVGLDECAVVDYEHEDRMRIDRRKRLRGEPGGQNSDTQAFWRKWGGRLANPEEWIGITTSLGAKAMNGTLRTVRIKDVPPNTSERTTMIEAFVSLGKAVQFNQRELLKFYSNWHVLANALSTEIKEFDADLVLTQVQGNNRSLIATIKELRKLLPSDVLIVNYDGDARFPLQEYHYRMAEIANLQLVSSATAVNALNDAGHYNVGWFLGSVEDSYFNVVRDSEQLDYDVVFLANYYADTFPEGDTRRTAVEALRNAGVNVDLFGGGWKRTGLSAHRRTDEDHERNAEIYRTAKLGLSISAFTDLYGYTSDRLWMMCATGCPALVQRFDGMEQLGFVDGETCIVWTSLNELISKVDYALGNDEWRERIGANGRQLMLERHTYKHRVVELLSMIDSLQEMSCFKAQMY